MQQHSPSALERSVSGFSNALAATGAIFLLPLLARHVRIPTLEFLRSGLDFSWALWGSWAVVFLIAFSVFFGGSALLQFIVQSMFRRSVRSRGPF